MAGAAGRLGARLRAVEARRHAREARLAAAPRFDPERLTAAERAAAEALTRRVRWRDGRPDFAGLSDAEFDRLAALVSKGQGREWRRG